MTDKLIVIESPEQEVTLLNRSDFEAEVTSKETEKPRSYLDLSHTDCG